MPARAPESGPIIDAAVLVPLYRDAAGELRIVLVRRTEGGTHGGQIALPGGKREPVDESLVATALREAHEEIGIDPGAVEILVELPAVVTMTTRFRIQPYLGRIVPPAAWRLDEREIAEIMDVAVGDLARPEIRGASMEKFASWKEPRRIEFFRLGSHRLWGATYRILEPIVPRLVRGDWSV